MLLNKESILGALDIDVKEIDVPQWGGKVKLKGLTAAEYDIYQQGLFECQGKDKKVNMINSRARMLSLMIVDQDNNKIFSQDDIETLGGKSSNAIEMLYREALRLNGDDVKQDDLEKN